VNGRAPTDLVRHMRLLIAEEAFLWELPQGGTDYYGGGRTVTHGPWRAADCQQVLARWFDCGLINCIAYSRGTKVRPDDVVRYEYDADWRTRATGHGQHHLVLAREDAGALLTDPTTWSPDGIGAGVMLCQSGQADGLSFDDWLGKLAGLPDQLIYEHPPDNVSGGEANKTLAEPETVLTARLWTSAIEQAAADGRPPVCPVNQDAYLTFDWDPTNGETAASESVEDVVCFLDRDKIGREQPFPFGRHRLWCPGCGAERYLVVTRNPG
jgi:hypothetical protein